MQGMLVKENDRYLFGGLVTALLRYVITFLIYFDISFSFEMKRKKKKSSFTPRRKEKKCDTRPLGIKLRDRRADHSAIETP